MSKPINVTLTGVAAVATAVAAVQSPGAGAITINGSLATAGVATLSSPARVTLTSGSDDSGITFTVVGTNRDGNAQSESLTGGNATAVTTTQVFKTVTSITHTGSVAGTLTAGNSAISSTPWVIMDYNNPVNYSIAAVLASGAANYTAEYTYDDPNASFTATFPTVYAFSGMTAQSTTKDMTAIQPVLAMRVTLNSGTGTLKIVFLQAGLAGH